MNSNVGHGHHTAGTSSGDSVAVSIEDVVARPVLDSRGFPTIRVDLHLADGAIVSGAAPSGASTGAHEAVELRDGGAAFGGKGVDRAIELIRHELTPVLVHRDWTDPSSLDAMLSDIDGTGQYARIGANSAVAISIAASRGFAHEAGLELHEWIARSSGSTQRMPVPHFNVLNGGAHAANALDFQEFMIAPLAATSEAEAVRIGADVYHALATLVKRRYGTAGLGDEGGFAPPIERPEEALDLLVEAITAAGYTPSRDGVAIALDPAANGFYAEDDTYSVGGRTLSRGDLVAYYQELVGAYPIHSIEDGFDETDHEGWAAMADALGDTIQLVGDDLYVTDPARIREGAEKKWSNAVLIKPNQIGTVTQTLEAIRTAREAGLACMVSHRSGETDDTFIADLAVGTGVGQIKSGAPARGERVAKYNRLTDIEAAGHLPFGLDR